MNLHVTLLGTGTSQGVPIIACDCEVCTSSNPRDHRLRCSVLLSVGDKNIVIDAGPDFRQQMLRAEVKSLEALLLTHAHNDHVIGLDDIRPFNFRQGGELNVYARPEVQKQVRQRFSYVFDAKPYPGAPQVRLNTITEEAPFQIADITFQPIRVMHGPMIVLGFRLGDFTYITDAKTIAPKELDKIRGSKILILNALHHNEHHSHLNLEEALAIIEEVQPQKCYLTHVSHRMGLIDEVNAQLPTGVELAYDGLSFEIPLS